MKVYGVGGSLKNVEVHMEWVYGRIFVRSESPSRNIYIWRLAMG